MRNFPLMGIVASSHRNAKSGALFTWGNNGQGQLGDGTTASKSSPVPIGAATNWTAVAAGGASTSFFSSGISGGALFTWGDGSKGQLGDGTTAKKSSPVPIGAATNWTAVAAGGGYAGTFALALRGGSLFSWGRDNQGQLGDGATTNQSSPVPIGAATNWTAVAAGGASTVPFSSGISGGALFTWGNNGQGQLGDGTTASKSSPVPIGAATNWTIISGGGTSAVEFSTGISGGALFTWGANGQGQLGDGTTAKKSSPVPIGASSTWKVSASGQPTTALGLN